MAKLNQALEGILGVDRTLNLAIVGAGHMGQAIANHESFRKRGFFVKAILDNAPAVIGQRVAGAMVKPVSQLAEIVKRERDRDRRHLRPRRTGPVGRRPARGSGRVGLVEFRPGAVDRAGRSRG